MALSMLDVRLPRLFKLLFSNGLHLLIIVREEIWHILCGKIDPEDSQLRFSRMGKNKSGPEALISPKIQPAKFTRSGETGGYYDDPSNS
ncbi:hypothetical protein Enr17x_13480 [Gimesia fumaroli]|uniref:Uncharacterized protein n=1 Tax=Gimesia fumaroli TaxID=2527976 RepID=A0A518I8A2_9PLAN|nr:hypothetical protein Enr17x_13480 [Gimesia fumaroli]